MTHMQTIRRFLFGLVTTIKGFVIVHDGHNA